MELTKEQISFLLSRFENGQFVGRAGVEKRKKSLYKIQLSLFRLGLITTGFRIEGIPIIYLTDKGKEAALSCMKKNCIKCGSVLSPLLSMFSNACKTCVKEES